MGALVNVFKSLFGGILGFLGGLLGGNKGSGGFYMEADSSQMEELPAAAPVAAKAVKAEKGKKDAPVAAKPAKAEKGKKAAPAAAMAVKAAPEKAAKVMTPEELIVAAVQGKAAGAEGGSAAGTTAGFATQYMVPTLTSGRRTPGPSLKGFKAMAKEIRG
jgi:hypothetical protein